MSSRIRYTESTQENYLESTQLFRGEKGGYYRVYINTVDNTYKVKNIKRNAIVRSTEKDGKKPPKNLYTTKQQVKRALKTLGVKFEREIRGL